MEISGSDKIESEKMANDDWDQLGETSKGNSNREKFVRDTAKIYEKARRSDYVRECRTGVQRSAKETRVEKVAAKEGEQEDAQDPTASGGGAAEVKTDASMVAGECHTGGTLLPQESTR
jgi:hypothetical protein